MTNDIKQLKKLAHEGDAKAQLDLSSSYSTGEGVEHDDEQAAHWK